jgi:DNA-binding MarR family transcriptional regulator
LNTFANRLQAKGDEFFDEVSWKQWFVLLGVSLYEDPPTMNEVAELIGSSHQNVKQILLKLERAGFAEMFSDELDRRRLRVRTTDKKNEFDRKYLAESQEFIDALFKGLDENDIAITINTIAAMEKNLIKIKKVMK